MVIASMKFRNCTSLKLAGFKKTLPVRSQIKMELVVYFSESIYKKKYIFSLLLYYGGIIDIQLE